MSEPDLEARLALDIFLKMRAGRYPQIIPESLDEDMEANPEGPFIRRENGTYGDWYTEIYEPFRRSRLGRRTAVVPAGERYTIWTDAMAVDPRRADMGEEGAGEPMPEELPQVQRYKCISSGNKLAIRGCKAEAKEILTEICKS